MNFFWNTVYVHCLKKACDAIFEHNSNINCPIIILFGTVLTETISYWIGVSFFHLTYFMHHHYLGNHTTWKFANSAINSAPAHRARDTIQLLPNSPNLNPVDYKIWGWCSSVCTNVIRTTSMSWSSASLLSGMVYSRTSLTRLSMKLRKRLRACVRTEGRQFEHFLWSSVGLKELECNMLFKCVYLQ